MLFETAMVILLILFPNQNILHFDRIIKHFPSFLMLLEVIGLSHWQRRSF